MLNNVVEILKVGLAGFSILCAWLSFRLLRQEQRKEHPNPRILRAIYTFTAFGLALVLIVAFVPLIGRSSRTETQGCQRAVARLQTILRLEETTGAGVRRTAQRVVDLCGDT